MDQITVNHFIAEKLYGWKKIKAREWLWVDSDGNSSYPVSEFNPANDQSLAVNAVEFWVDKKQQGGAGWTFSRSKWQQKPDGQPVYIVELNWGWTGAFVRTVNFNLAYTISEALVQALKEEGLGGEEDGR